MYNLLTILILNIISLSFQQEIIEVRNGHTFNELNTKQITHLSNLENRSYMDELLDNILIPRVVGTSNHEKVYNYIKEEISKLNWNIAVDEFVENTPKFGRLTFRNIIATLNPDADRYLVLACHYDSKYFDNGDFIGATDSGVPCAMMINLIKVMKNELDSIRDNNEVSLKLIFFDGEEAFEQWGPKDSIYGAKHLAKKMHQSYTKSYNGQDVTELDRIDILMLLDLIGTPNPKFYNFFENTHKWHVQLCDIEDQLDAMQLTKKKSNRKYFSRKAVMSYIEDDHIPFIQRSVPVLHVIPNPFPKVWHTLKDNRDAIDMTTVENINKILRIFTAGYLHLSVLGQSDSLEENHEEL